MYKTNKIALELEAYILANYLPGQKISSEMQLTKKYKVSRMTIRNALLILINKGMLVSKQGKGYFVQDIIFWNKLLSFQEKEKSRSNSCMITRELPLDDFFIQNFGLNPEDFHSFIKIRYKDDCVTKYSIIWYQFHLFRDWDEELIAQSFLSYIASQNIELKTVFKTVILLNPNSDDYLYLPNIERYQFLPKKYSISFDDQNNVVECSLETYIPEAFSFTKIERK